MNRKNRPGNGNGSGICSVIAPSGRSGFIAPLIRRMSASSPWTIHGA
jgi:hypothetical protein